MEDPWELHAGREDEQNQYEAAQETSGMDGVLSAAAQGGAAEDLPRSGDGEEPQVQSEGPDLQGQSATPPALSPAAGDLHTLGVTDLHKRFGRKEVVRGVNFFMHNGEVAGLLGPNGAGKTTIFYMIVGFYQPSAGFVAMDGIDITAKPMYRRARQGIAYLPQEASIFRKLTVEQNIWAILESRRDIDKAAQKERLESLLEEFGIGRIRSQYGFTLSGGERRRTEIARALATEPKFLLLDEPFAGIDPIAVYEIKQIIRRLAEKGIGILITDHNVRDTLEITTEAFIIADGTIVARGDRDVILADEMVREVYLGSEFRM
jgi:lipopolysaccharide export system ATP-binding protein